MEGIEILIYKFIKKDYNYNVIESIRRPYGCV
jgi:hypothetical protein